MLSRDEVIKDLFENAKKAEEEVIDVTQNLPQENS